MNQALTGWNVLIPRGGAWGDIAAAQVHSLGATPVVAPLIGYAEPVDPVPLENGLLQLSRGDFDWLVVTSASTVRSLSGVGIPETTRVAAVGPATATALTDAGLRVDLVPSTDFSAASLAASLAAHRPGGPTDLRVFLPQSASADPALADALRASGFGVHAVTAYRTVSVTAEPSVVARLRSGGRWAILVTSGSVARAVAEQLYPLPAVPAVGSPAAASPTGVALVCIGARTATQATALGLPVAAVAAHQSLDSMLDTLIRFTKEHP